MENLKLSLPLVDGSLLPIEFENGRDLIHRIWGDDFGAPPRALEIEAVSQSGEIVKIVVPYDERPRARVEITRI